MTSNVHKKFRQRQWSKLETLYILARLGTTQCLPWWKDGWMDGWNLFIFRLFNNIGSACACGYRCCVCVESPIDLRVTSVPHVHHKWSLLSCVTVSFGIPHDPTKAILCKNLDKHRGNTNTSYVKVPYDLCHHCLTKNTHKPIKPPFSFIWLQTGGFKIHIKRCKWWNSV